MKATKTNPDDSVFTNQTNQWSHIHDDYEPIRSLSLTKREYFAAMAMQGMLTNELLCDPEENANVARDAVSAADALITELNKND